MKKLITGLLAAISFVLMFNTAAFADDADMPRVRIQTNMGDIVVELDRAKAPDSVRNFIAYTESGFYEGTIFHRVIDGFMIQAGGYDTQYTRKQPRPPIKNEADNGLKNLRGTIVMARTNDPHSATSQFFINVKDNDFLNYSNPTPRGYGYAVFGRVVEGMDTVDKIRQVKTGFGGPFPKNVPQTPIVINTVSVE